MKQKWSDICFLCVPAPLHTAGIMFHSPFHFLMIGMGNMGDSSSQNTWAICDFCPYISIRGLSLHRARWSYFMRQVHQPPDLAFFTLEIKGIIVLCPSTRSLHIPPYAYCSPPCCTCSYEKWFYIKSEKKVLKKGTWTKYQICRYSKPKSIHLGKIWK